MSVYGTCEVHTFSLNAVSLYICRKRESLKWKQAIIKGENFTILLLLYIVLVDDHGHVTKICIPTMYNKVFITYLIITVFIRQLYYFSRIW